MYEKEKLSHKKTSNKKLEVFQWFLQESNQGHMDFQSIALPTELRNHYIFVGLLRCFKVMQK